MTISENIRAGTKYLTENQAVTGAFLGHASRSQSDFSSYRIHETPFFTSLILDSLQDVPSTVRMRSRAADFLLTVKSEYWSWNYWLPNSLNAQNQPYPDDLDDTACALAALFRERPHTIDGSALGTITRHLTNAEAQPGGPYQTWLIDSAAYPIWHDIDLAVNANIGYYLALQDVSLTPLENYITKQLAGGKLTSRYYIGGAPIVYFLSRWYKGAGLKVMLSFIRRAAREQSFAYSPVMLAMMLSSGLRLNMPKIELQHFALQLAQLQHDGHWGAAALYYEPPVNGVAFYAGSECLSTALALEALVMYRDLEHVSDSSTEARPVLTRRAVVPADQKLLSGELRTAYCDFMRKLIAQDKLHEITAMATTTAAMLGGEHSCAAIKHLDLAALHGWAAYTIYDDVIDEEINPKLIGVANFALRRTLHHFQQALPEHEEFQDNVAQCFVRMDAANAWEATRARSRVRARMLQIGKLPDYTNYIQLADRSWGHHLAAAAVLCGANFELSSPEQQQLQIFYRHYLIARQLHDDVHDWEADLLAGRLSAVVTLLIKATVPGASTINLAEELPFMRQVFWQQTILEVATLINDQLAQARRALKALTVFHEPLPYQTWIKSLQAALDETLRQRESTIKFIQSYDRS